MKTRWKPVLFAPEEPFEVKPVQTQAELQVTFAGLQRELLDQALASTQTVTLRRRLQQAARDAASLAWTTPVPLLAYPVLFEELALRERARDNRQRSVIARSEMLLEHAV